LAGVSTDGGLVCGLDDEHVIAFASSTVLELALATNDSGGSTTQQVKLSKVPYS
jgi:hypothetical protein